MRLIVLLLLSLGCAAWAGERSLLSGEYMEDRANHVFGCYCEWSGEGETAGREAFLAWNVLNGEYEGVPMAGVKFVLVIKGDRTLSRAGAVRQSVLFVDTGASAQQAWAVERVMRRNYPEMMGELLRVQRQPVSFERTEIMARLRVGNEVEVVMRRAQLPEDALPGARDWYDPFVPMTEVTLGTTLADRYSGAEFGHRWARFDQGVTGYFGTFTMQAR